MKILELNGYKYSREQFDGYKFRAKFRFTVSDDWREDMNMDIYTDNPDKIAVEKVINSKKKEVVKSCEMEYWTTKEQDDISSKFLNEWLKEEL